MQSNTSFSAYAISEALNNKNKIKPLEENKNPKSEERKKMLPKKKKDQKKRKKRQRRRLRRRCRPALPIMKFMSYVEGKYILHNTNTCLYLFYISMLTVCAL